jgi:hypothetical protein
MKAVLAIALSLAGATAIALGQVPLVVEKIPPVKAMMMSSGKPNILFADFGKDAYGNLEIRFSDFTPQGPVTIRLGERLDAKGAIDRNPPGSVNYREIILSLKEGVTTYRLEIPRKPRHNDPAAVPVREEIGEITPFRYVEIEGKGIDPASTKVTQLAVHAPFDEALSSFDSSDPTLNAVWNLCKQTMKASTAFGLFIDGERERIPYEGDAYINELSFAAYDPDPRLIRATFDRLMDHPTWPTEWLLHMPMIAAADYMATGDPAIAAKHYDELKKRILALKTRQDGLLVAPAIVDWPVVERDNYNEGVPSVTMPKEVGPEVNTVANAFYCHALDRMAFLAEALGRMEDAADFKARGQKARTSFNRVFFDPRTGIYTDGEGSSHSSLHANMFPVAFGLVPDAHVGKVADYLKAWGMACSVYGSQYLLEALMDAGCDRAAIALMSSHSPRSWQHMIDSGSTMTWEAWDPSVKPNLTWNHAWGAAPANILSRFVLGVRPLEPGYSKVLIAPQPGDLAWVKGTVPTLRGPVKVKVDNETTFRLEVTLPPGVTGEVRPPQCQGREYLLDGEPVCRQPAHEDKKDSIVIIQIPSGNHFVETHRANLP